MRDVRDVGDRGMGGGSVMMTTVSHHPRPNLDQLVAQRGQGRCFTVADSASRRGKFVELFQPIRPSWWGEPPESNKVEVEQMAKSIKKSWTGTCL